MATRHARRACLGSLNGAMSSLILLAPILTYTEAGTSTRLHQNHRYDDKKPGQSNAIRARSYTVTKRHGPTPVIRPSRNSSTGETPDSLIDPVRYWVGTLFNVTISFPARDPRENCTAHVWLRLGWNSASSSRLGLDGRALN